MGSNCISFGFDGIASLQKYISDNSTSTTCNEGCVIFDSSLCVVVLENGLDNTVMIKCYDKLNASVIDHRLYNCSTMENFEDWFFIKASLGSSLGFEFISISKEDLAGGIDYIVKNTENIIQDQYRDCVIPITFETEKLLNINSERGCKYTKIFPKSITTNIGVIISDKYKKVEILRDNEVLSSDNLRDGMVYKHDWIMLYETTDSTVPSYIYLIK